MKRICLLVLLAGGMVLSENPTFAQGKAFYQTPYRSRNSGSFDRSSNLLSFGFGVPNRSGADYDFWDDDDRVGFGPMYIKYEHGIVDEIGIGIYGAMAASRYKYGPDDRYRDNTLAIGLGVMGFYHFNKLIPVRQLDVYAGAGLGFRSIGYSYDDDFPGDRDDRSDFDPVPLFKVGARYYFTRVFGIYGEGGYDKMSDVNFGITLRF